MAVTLSIAEINEKAYDYPACEHYFGVGTQLIYKESADYYGDGRSDGYQGSFK
jgi:hypothetical protein